MFAQGAMTIALDAGEAYRLDPRRAVGAGDSSLSSSMCLLVRLPYFGRDPATATDIVAMCQCPGPNIARAGRPIVFGPPPPPPADLACVCHPWRQRFTEPCGILRRQVDFILSTVTSEADRRVRGAP